jgi:hypothetical protein
MKYQAFVLFQYTVASYCSMQSLCKGPVELMQQLYSIIQNGNKKLHSAKTPIFLWISWSCAADFGTGSHWESSFIPSSSRTRLLLGGHFLIIQAK